MTKSAKSQNDCFPDGAVPLESILFTEELHRRPSRSPDYEQENHALVALASALADSPSTIFQRLAETIHDITQCDSAGLSLLTRDGKTPDVCGERFYWPAIAGVWNPHVGGGTPRNFGPCGDVLDQNRTLLFRHFERRYPYLIPVIPAAEECLLVPFYVAGEAVGTIWAIMHNDRRRFDAEDDRVMASLGKFASSAYQARMHIEHLKIQVAEREKAEAAVRELANGLETQVRVRTKDLERSTRDLLDTNEALEREIAERKRAKEALQVRALNLRLLVDSIPAPVAVMTPSGEVESVNKPNLEYFGKTFEDLKKWGTSDAVHPDDLPHAVEIWMEAIQTGQPYDVKERLRRFDGVYRWFEVRGFPLRSPDGRILNWCVLLTDIDDRQRAEEALRLSEAHLSQAQTLAHVGSWVWQIAGRKAVYLSEEWYRVFGFDPKVGMPTWEERLQRVHPEDRAKWQAAIDRAIDEKSDYDLEVRILPPDTAVRYVHSLGHPVLGSSGELVQFVGVSMDVTQSRQAEQAFRLLVVGTAATTGSDFFQSLVQHMAQALRARYAFVSTCDEQKHARTLAFWKGDGFGEDFDFEIADTPCEKVLHGEVCRYRQGLQGLFPGDKLLADWQAESYLGVPMLDRSNRVIGHLAILDDKPMEADSRAIDLLKIFASRAAAELNRQKAEDELQAAMQERERMREELAHLAHLNRVSTMGELTASLAHEIKQPITAAVTDAQACLRWLDRDQPAVVKAREAASRLIGDAKRASDIISRVGSLFKKDIGHRELVDVNDVIQEMIMLLRSEAARYSITIACQLSDGLPKITADRIQLQQVLMNLMINGIEATKDLSKRGELSIKSQEDGNRQVIVSVHDNGAGLPPEQVEQIFNAFFTTKPQGTGLGLAISRSIVESHGGRLWATCDNRSGATFYFTLPIEATAHQAA
jgi:PAS domain S-box-containing protein